MHSGTGERARYASRTRGSTRRESRSVTSFTRGRLRGARPTPAHSTKTLTRFSDSVALLSTMHRRLALAAAVVTAVAVTQNAAAATPKTPSPTKGVVLVNTDLALEQASAAGTGIVLTKTGEILTNNHVIAGATTVKVTVPATHKTYTADVVGYDVADDVALLQVEGASNMATATMGNSARVKVGQAARAVGNANGGGRLIVTKGKVVGLNRTISVQQDDGSFSKLANLVATTARLVPGDSGGPLVNASGRVIGMDAAGSASGTGSVGFAIAINKALTIRKEIAAQKASALVHIGATAFIGIQAQDGPNGVLVAGTLPNSPAEAAGLVGGDVITAIDTTTITDSAGLRAFLFGRHPGDAITIAYTDSAGNPATVTITLAEGPPV
jgi:S1-C subfamily serine protease